MTFDAHMRIGSLEIVAVLFAAAAIAARPRTRLSYETGGTAPTRVRVAVVEPGGRRVFEGYTPVLIGRAGEAALNLADPEASRRHARIESHDGIVYLRDLESSNGTFLNGRRLTSTIELREGDEVDVGTTRLTVEHMSEATSSWT